jgi:act minimal PKS chain-length factor (CLF/KS beta)
MPLARLAGIAVGGVPSEPYKFAPDPAAIERTIRMALADAGARPVDVGLWFPSRNGVLEMDRAEGDVIRSVFGRVPRAISVKDAIGEMAASGGGQIVAACRAIAGAPGLFPEDGRPRRALVNSFGAGGNFMAAVFESIEEEAA